MFVALWEYEVKPGCEKRFEEAYGPGGGWVRLFRSDSNHIETRLLRDPFRRAIYVTVDFWNSRGAYEKFMRRCFGAEKGFCGQIAAAHSAFHGGGPASLGPVTCQKQARDGGLLPGAPAINTGFRRKRRGSLLDYRGLQQFRVACRRKGFPDFAQTEVDNFLTWLLQQIVRRADNQLQVLSGWHCVCCSI